MAQLPYPGSRKFWDSESLLCSRTRASMQVSASSPRPRKPSPPAWPPLLAGGRPGRGEGR
eukprot:12609913-Alexandrium_andersonii.AAC.1